jgi:hypothetical protein
MCLKIPAMNSGMQIRIQAMKVWGQEGIGQGHGGHADLNQGHMIVKDIVLQNTLGLEVDLEKGPM